MTVTSIAVHRPRARTHLDRGPATVVVNIQIAVPGDASDTAGIFALANRLHALAADQTATARVSTTITVTDQTSTDTLAPAPLPAMAAPGLVLFADRRMALIDGQRLCLTRLEYDLLLHLADNRGRVATRDQLRRQVWGHTLVSTGRTIDVHVHRLRVKLAGRGPDIITVRGIGYRLDRLHRVTVMREREPSR